MASDYRHSRDTSAELTNYVTVVVSCADVNKRNKVSQEPSIELTDLEVRAGARYLAYVQKALRTPVTAELQRT